MPFKYREIERNLKKWDFKLFVKKVLMLFSQMEGTPFRYQISPGVERQLLKILSMTRDEFRNIK